MFDKPGFIRLVGSVLLATLVVLAGIGVAGWNEILPDAPATGRLVLGLSGLAALFGLWELWRPQRSNA